MWILIESGTESEDIVYLFIQRSAALAAVRGALDYIQDGDEEGEANEEVERLIDELAKTGECTEDGSGARFSLLQKHPVDAVPVRRPRKEFDIDDHHFTVVKNPTGTGGYVLACQTLEPTFVCVTEYETAEIEASKYLQGKNCPSEGDNS